MPAKSKWIVRWIDFECESREQVFEDLASAIQAAQSFADEIERVHLFQDDDHVATYYTPKKGFWL